MTDAESQALQEVVRQLNAVGPEPSYGKARAAVGAASVAVHDAYAAADELAGDFKANALGLTYSSSSAKRALDAVNQGLSRTYDGPISETHQATDLCPDDVWSSTKQTVINAYTTAFAVRATAEDVSTISFGHELGQLSQNLSEAPGYASKALEAVGDAGATVLDKVAKPVVGSAVGALLPLLIVVGVLAYLVLNSKAGAAAAGAAARRP